MVKVERSIEVNVPVNIVYQELCQFEEYPRFMKGVHSVHQLDDAHLHWRAERAGKEMEWDAEITERIPERSIAWRNTSGPRSEGQVVLEAVAPGKTRISLSMEADEAVLDLGGSGDLSTLQDEGDLARFKKMLESAKAVPGAGYIDTAGEKPFVRNHQTDSAGAEDPRATGASGQAGEQKTQPWDDPLRMMRKVGAEMEQLLGRWIGPGGLGRGALPGLRRQQEWSPPVDIEQHAGQLHICADLPGVSKQDVQIEIIRDQLTIEGERRGRARHQAYRRAECNYGHFYRTITLPEGVDPDSAQARMHDGVLDITFVIAAAPDNARRLDIQGG